MNEVKVPFHKSELLSHETRNLQSYLADICNSGNFAGGKYLGLLEKKIAEISNKKFAVAFSSGTAALFCAVSALRMEGIVITTPHTWIATTNAIEMAGCYPTYYDVDKNGLLDMLPPPPGFTAQDIQETYGGLLPVSLYGQKVNYENYKAYHSIPKILDGCHSINQLDYLDKDDVFDIVCFSLHPTKLFFAGEGGFAVTNWENLAEEMKMFRCQGLDKDKLRRKLSIKFVIPEFSAACGLTTLESFDKRVTMQRKRIQTYLEEIAGWAILRDNIRVISDIDCTMMTIEFAEGKRDDVLKHLENNGYQASVKYPDLLYNMKPITRENFPMTRKMTKCIMTLPCYPTMEWDEIKAVVDSIVEYFSYNR